MKRYLTLLLYSIGCFCVAAYGQTTFSAATDRTIITPGEQVTVVATLSISKNIGGLPTPSVASTDAFVVLQASQNQSSSSSIEIVNGRASQKTEISYRFIYVISPKKTGSFTFPSVQVTVDGNTYKTNPITFTVSNQQVHNTDIHVSLELKNRTLYIGEQTVLTFKVAQRNQSSSQVERGFSAAVERIEKSFGKNFSLNRLFTNQVKSGSEQIGGELYRTFSLSYALSPLTEGTFVIPAVPFEYEELQRVQRRRTDPFFDDFFGDAFGGGVQAIARTALSNSLSIAVKALPPAPAGFTGAVGSFSVAASADPPSVPSGEAVTLKIILKSSTRPSSTGDIAMPKLQDCDVFTPERHIEVDTTENGIITRKSYKYLVIPHQEGTMTIPSITLPYFDPAAGVYRSASSEPLSITVTRGETESKPSTHYLTQEEIRVVGKDIRYIKTEVPVGSEPDKPYREPIFFLLYPIPFLIVIFSIAYRFQAVRKERNAAANNRQRAIRSTFKEVEKVRKEGSKLSPTDFVGKLSAVVEHYISNKFEFAATGRTLDELKGELLMKSVSTGIVEELTAFIEKIDGIRFGGMAFDERSRKVMLDQASSFLTNLEKIKKDKRP